MQAHVTTFYFRIEFEDARWSRKCSRAAEQIKIPDRHELTVIFIRDEHIHIFQRYIPNRQLVDGIGVAEVKVDRSIRRPIHDPAPLQYAATPVVCPRRISSCRITLKIVVESSLSGQEGSLQT